MIWVIIFPTQVIAFVQGRGQSGFDVKVVELAVCRPVNNPRRVQPVMAQSGNEGLRVPPLTVCRQTVAGNEWPKGV